MDSVEAVKRNGAYWIEAGWFPVSIGLICNRENWATTQSEYHLEESWPEKWGAGAYTNMYVSDDTGERIILVALFRPEERDEDAVLQSIIHEAVHVWQYICEALGEDDPGVEVEAYSIHSIAMRLLSAWRVERKNFKREESGS